MLDRKTQRYVIPLLFAGFSTYVLSVCFKNNYDRRDYLKRQRLVDSGGPVTAPPKER